MSLYVLVLAPCTLVRYLGVSREIFFHDGIFCSVRGAASSATSALLGFAVSYAKVSVQYVQYTCIGCCSVFPYLLLYVLYVLHVLMVLFVFASSVFSACKLLSSLHHYKMPEPFRFTNLYYCSA